MNTIKIGLVVLVFALGACSTLEGKIGEVRELVQKGEEITNEVAVKMATEFVGYCRSDVTRVARKLLRDKINEKLVAMEAEYRVANLCEKAE